VSPIGQPFAAHNPEPYIPEKWDRESYVRAIEYGNGRIIGLKLRLQKDVIGTISGERLLKESVKLATDLKMPLSIHITDPALPISEVVQYLRPGDVLTHIFHGRGYTIFENNKIPEPIMAARKRGVIYDVGHGGVNFSATIARKAVEQGFLPDMISTDNTLYGWLKPDLYSLPNVMSMFLSFGMEVRDIVRCVTAKPANVVGMENKIGTLAPGASGDVTILKIRERPVKFTNSFGETHSGNAIFVPQAVLINGELLYRPEDSAVERSAAQYFKI
jgi:predicted amidohydrolase